MVYSQGWHNPTSTRTIMIYLNTIYWYGFVIAWIIHTIYIGSIRHGESRTLALVFGILYAIIWPVLPLYYAILVCYFFYRKLVINAETMDKEEG